MVVWVASSCRGGREGSEDARFKERSKSCTWDTERERYIPLNHFLYPPPLFPVPRTTRVFVNFGFKSLVGREKTLIIASDTTKMKVLIEYSIFLPSPFPPNPATLKKISVTAYMCVYLSAQGFKKKRIAVQVRSEEVLFHNHYQVQRRMLGKRQRTNEKWVFIWQFIAWTATYLWKWKEETSFYFFSSSSFNLSVFFLFPLSFFLYASFFPLFQFSLTSYQTFNLVLHIPYRFIRRNIIYFSHYNPFPL